MLCNSDHNSSGSTYESRWGEGKCCTMEERHMTVGMSTGLKTKRINRDIREAKGIYI